MFENDQEIVKFLLNESNDFKRLYDKHGNIKKKVQEANEGNLGVEDDVLESLKKEKLFLKDRMSLMIEDYRRNHV